jgi:hypothetical protein
LTSGCGRTTGELTGRVIFQDKHLQQGTVLVASSSGSVHSGVIQSDGTYMIPGIPVGPARIAVNCPDPREVKVIPRKKEEKMPAADLSKWIAIPEKFADPEKSGLSIEIKPGTNAFPIDLK